MDEWIQVRAAELVLGVRQEMEAYNIYSVPPMLMKMLDDFTNWYVRMNRARLKGAQGAQEAQVALSVLPKLVASSCKPAKLRRTTRQLRRYLRIVLSRATTSSAPLDLPLPRPPAATRS